MNESTTAISNISESIGQMDNPISSQFLMVTETSSRMNTMSVKVNGIIDTIENNHTLASDLKIMAEDKIRKMEMATDAIRKVAMSSEKISEFLVTINDISDHTNILSLNASIEASNAGIFGKGFSIVAGEIRKLAAASAVHEKEISGSVGKIIQNIQLAESISIEACNAFYSIVEKVIEINTSMSSAKDGTSDLVQMNMDTGNMLEKLLSFTEKVKDASASTNRNTVLIETGIRKITEIDTIGKLNEDNSVRLSNDVKQFILKQADI